MSGVEIWGHTASGEAVHRLTIKGGGLTAQLITWGAALQDLRLVGHKAPLVLGFQDFDDYLAASPYFGANVGRCANRIANGRFVLDGAVIQLDINFRDKHHLHGGAVNAGKRVWQLIDHGESHASFEIESADGDMGYPGHCVMRCFYVLGEDGIMSIRYESQTDAKSICNMVHHSYFNLIDGGQTPIDAHEVRIDAEHYLPVDEELIPTGEVALVAGTDYDFRAARPIFINGAHPVIYDHNFCLSNTKTDMRRVINVYAPESGVSMFVETDQPGVQFYAGNTLGRPQIGLLGSPYPNFAGFCFETQGWPDAVNHSHFPSVVVEAGEVYTHEVRYGFRKASDR